MLHEQAELTGTVHQGVIVIDDGVELPEGQTVKIIVERAVADETPQAETVGQRLMKFAGTIEGLPPDFALNHDRYLYGAEKRDCRYPKRSHRHECSGISDCRAESNI